MNINTLGEGKKSIGDKNENDVVYRKKVKNLRYVQGDSRAIPLQKALERGEGNVFNSTQKERVVEQE